MKGRIAERPADRASPLRSARLGAMALTISLLAAPASAEPEVGIVTFTVDNSTSHFFKNFMPEFIHRDIPGTIFVVTGLVGSTPEFMSWDDVRSLQRDGWEVGSHSHSHAQMSQATDAEIEMELGVSAAQIYRATGVYPVTFASPFGDHDARVVNRARLYYDAHFLGWGNMGKNPFDQTDHFQINRKQVANTRTAEDICAEMERAGREGYWQVYIWHWVTETPVGEYDNATDQFLDVLDCADALRDRGIIRLMTARDALKVVPDTPR